MPLIIEMVLDQNKTSRSTGSSTHNYLLVSPSGMIRFYQYLQKSVEKQPDIEYSNDGYKIAYKTIMNKLEQGLYIPGPEMEIIHELIKLNKTDFVRNTKSGQASRHQVTLHNTVWDHPHFKLLPSDI